MGGFIYVLMNRIATGPPAIAMPLPLYITDLDGTLLTAQATLSHHTRKTLQHLLSQGLPFTIATSRSVTSVRNIFSGIDLPLPIIEVNGAFVTDLKTGQHEAIQPIAPQLLPDLIRLVEQNGCSPILSSYDGQRDRLYSNGIHNPGIGWYADDCKTHNDPRWKQIPHLSQALTEQIVRLTIIDREPKIQTLATAIRQTYGPSLTANPFPNPYQPGWTWLTLQSSQSTKAQAIQALKKTHGLEDRELIVFGDHNNDLEMFEIADRAVAVANATPELKQRATQTIDHHTTDSVINYIAKDWATRTQQPSHP